MRGNGLKQAAKAIVDTGLAQDCTEEELLAFLENEGATIRSFAANEIVCEADKPFPYLLFQLEGESQFVMTLGSTRQILRRARPGDGFCETIALRDGNGSVAQIESVGRSKVLFIPADAVLRGQSTTARALQVGYVRLIPEKVAELATKFAIMQQPNLKDRLLAYFVSLPQEEDGTISVPFKYKDLADYLGVNKSAVSRALHRMQNDGIIEIHKKTIRIL